MENLLFTFTQKKYPSKFLVEQRVKSNEQRVKRNEQIAKTNEQRATSYFLDVGFKAFSTCKTIFKVVT